MRSSPEAEANLWGVILAGGIGSRFWPASTPALPKQLLPLASEQPLIQDTLDRITPLIPLDRIRILAGERLARPIADAVPALEARHFLLEPRAAGTAPVLAWAAAEIERLDPEGVMVSMHSDHRIEPAERFREQVHEAARLAAAHQRLFTIGAVPDRPETGYGYIHVGERLPPAPGSTGTAREVDEFVEKPNAETAGTYLASGEYLWNTGIFVWRVRDLLDQLERHTPELAHLIPALRAGDSAAFFRQVPTLSIDEGLLERSDRVAVLPAEFGWDDIGAWDALYRSRPLDPEGNVHVGSTVTIDSSGCALYAAEGAIVAFGVEDLVVVRTAGVTFVTTRARSSQLKQLIDRLPSELRNLE